MHSARPSCPPPSEFPEFLRAEPGPRVGAQRAEACKGTATEGGAKWGMLSLPQGPLPKRPAASKNRDSKAWGTGAHEIIRED